MTLTYKTAAAQLLMCNLDQGVATSDLPLLAGECRFFVWLKASVQFPILYMSPAQFVTCWNLHQIVASNPPIAAGAHWKPSSVGVAGWLKDLGLLPPS